MEGRPEPGGRSLRRASSHPWAWQTLGRLAFLPLVRLDRRTRALGLERTDGHPLRRGRWCGDRGGRRLWIRASVESGPDLGLRVELEAPLPREVAFVLERQSEGFEAEGAAACVGSALRALLGAGDVLGASPEGPHFASRARRAESRLVTLIAGLEQIADAFGATPVPRLLLQRVLEDPDPACREDAYRALLGHYPSSPEAERAERLARGDQAWGVRLAAAERRPAAEAWAGVLEVASAALAPVEVRARALRWLSSVATPAGEGDEARRALLEGFTGDPVPTLRAVAIRALASVGRGPPERARFDPAPEVRLATVEALEQLGGIEGETLLLDLLCRAEHLDGDDLIVRRAAIEALGRFGSARCVPVLAQFSDGAGFRAPLSEAALTAIYLIRQRLPVGARGSLSVVEGSSGALSQR